MKKKEINVGRFHYFYKFFFKIYPKLSFLALIFKALMLKKKKTIGKMPRQSLYLKFSNMKAIYIAF